MTKVNPSVIKRNLGMLTKIALANSENTALIFDLNFKEQSMASRRVDLVTLPDEEIDSLFYDQNDECQTLGNIIQKEDKFYPIIPLQTLGLSKENCESLEFAELAQSYEKATTRWVLQNNIKQIEQLYPTIKYLKDLWVKDRNSFFEELWFIVKSNLATTELNIIFHDLKEPSEKQAEKGEKPSLCYSYVKGNKLPHLFEGKESEEYLMKEYEAEFGQFFNITEYSSEKNQLIACAKIGLSPILIMARINSLNQLQQSVLIALFTGLQEE